MCVCMYFGALATRGGAWSIVLRTAIRIDSVSRLNEHARYCQQALKLKPGESSKCWISSRSDERNYFDSRTSMGSFGLMLIILDRPPVWLRRTNPIGPGRAWQGEGERDLLWTRKAPIGLLLHTTKELLGAAEMEQHWSGSVIEKFECMYSRVFVRNQAPAESACIKEQKPSGILFWI